MSLADSIARVLPWRGRPSARSDEAEPLERPRLPADLARKVRRIEVATRRLVDHGVAGEYHAVFKGRGVEFAEVRPYQPGDDVRSIDWNVTARSGEPYVKKYVEERDLTVFLAVDVSGSQSFGSRAIVKRDLAAEVAALLAFAAVRNGDRVGAALLSDHMELFLPPRRRRNHVLRLIREVLIHPAEGGTDLGAALGQTVSALSRRSVLFLISDFLTDPLPRAIEAAAARHDLVVVEIVDPRDAELPEVAPVPLRDAETGRTALVGGVGGARMAEEHRARWRAERTGLRRHLRKVGVDHLVLRTDRPYLGALVGFFEARRRRLAR